jgi:hypothetical protein
MEDKPFFDHDVWFEPKFDLYPITVRQARYSGVYEGADWYATALEKDGPSQALMDYMYGDDCDAADYWYGPDSVFVGIGNTPSEAVENLIERFKDPTKFMGPTRIEGDSDDV